MTNAQQKDDGKALYVSMEVSQKQWKLGMTDLVSERVVSVDAWDEGGLVRAVRKAQRHFGLDARCAVYSCYEASRCGFSIHRFLASQGIENAVVDPASIEVSRRKRRRKTDRLDAKKLVRMLVRYHVYGERTCWQVCRVPTPQQEAERRVDREYDRLMKERKGHVNRIRSLLELHGVQVDDVRGLKPGRIRDRSRRLLEAPWQDEIGRELERLRLVDAHLEVLGKQRRAALGKPQTEADRKAAQLKWLHGIGEISATALSREFFAWRRFKNRREVGAAAGLTGCPYDSGESRIEQGITKAGSRRVRMLMIELAWMWLRHQPHSALSQWFEKRFAQGGKRMRRIGIVALARKLLVALWKFLEWGLVPEGAIVHPAEPADGWGPPRRVA